MKRLGRALLLEVCVFAAAFATSPTARAYVWMIDTHDIGCAACHADPSGGGILSPYGRDQGDVRLRQRYPGEPPGAAKFLWGTVDLPQALWLQGELQSGFQQHKVEGEALDRRSVREIELRTLLELHPVRLSASLGYVRDGALRARLTDDENDNLVSREHWIGLSVGEAHEWSVRGGRLNVPFGLRNVERGLLVRQLTDTQIDDGQQHGIAAAVSMPALRAELMGIAGNFQERDSEARQLGYAGYAELSGAAKVTLGASSQITHADRDAAYGVPTFRQAHGAFARVAAYKPLVLLLEADWVLHTPKGIGHYSGVVALAQGDYELVRGVHLIATAELANVGRPQHPLTWGGWLSYAWFFAPHADIRIDGTYRSIALDDERTEALTFLARAHVYL